MFKKTLDTLIISLPLILNSCNVITQMNEDLKLQELREQGYNPYHLNGCGPNSLFELLSQLNINIEQREISRIILENHPIGNIMRSMLGLIDNESMRITWPWEIKDTLNRYLEKDKFKITVKTGDNTILKSDLIKYLFDNKKGIALIRNYANIFDYHWINFKDQPPPFAYYGKNTVISALYVIDEK